MTANHPLDDADPERREEKARRFRELIDRLGTAAIVKECGVSRTTVKSWRDKPWKVPASRVESIIASIVELDMQPDPRPEIVELKERFPHIFDRDSMTRYVWDQLTLEDVDLGARLAERDLRRKAKLTPDSQMMAIHFAAMYLAADETDRWMLETAALGVLARHGIGTNAPYANFDLPSPFEDRYSFAMEDILPLLPEQIGKTYAVVGSPMPRNKPGHYLATDAAEVFLKVLQEKGRAGKNVETLRGKQNDSAAHDYPNERHE